VGSFYNDNGTYIKKLLQKVKINLYWWMKAANAVYVLGTHTTRNLSFSNGRNRW